jgi:hypothetical protein
MSLKAFPTKPVAFPGIGALVGYVHSALFWLRIILVISVALINAGHVVPF